MPGSHAWPYLGLSNLTIVANQADGLYIGREEKVDGWPDWRYRPVLGYAGDS